jgi:hypothetical protein
MRSNCIPSCGRFVAFAVVGAAIGSVVLMLLWNWLTPALFGWKQIGFLQAAAMLVLSRMLFGGVLGRCGHDYWRSSFTERLERMSPEEREKFRAGIRSKWCGCGPSGDATSTGA